MITMILSTQPAQLDSVNKGAGQTVMERFFKIKVSLV